MKAPYRYPMVCWYDPAVLARAAAYVGIANLFGRNSDTRLIEALATQPQHQFDYANAASESGEFWLDFVADLGDGWNSTYAIACAVAEPALTVASAGGASVATQGGAALIFGGDEVYPYPSKEAYAKRTEAPYAMAFAGAVRHPDVFAVPGNHDWYDSLVAFSRLFCRPDRAFAGCRTQQTRSYFALQLPGNWWLLAIDLQLDADLDEPQVRYFKDIATQIAPDAHVILCVPTPQWIYEKSYPGHTSYEDATLVYFEREVLKHQVAVYLTGDLHCYKRHERDDGVQKIVSGGGGAFLHPTHAPRTDSVRGGFHQRACYPDEATSARLTWRNFLFPLLNPRYMWIPAVLYCLSAWLASASLTAADTVSLSKALHAAIAGGIRNPFDGLWLLLYIGAFVLFTDTHVRWFRIAGGICHAIAHLFAAFGLGWLALRFTTRLLGFEFGDIPQMLLSGGLTFFGGGMVGSMVLGIYLFLSLALFGRHSEEAFSSLRIEDWKQFLRMRITPRGELSLFAICIDRVPRSWRFNQQAGRSRYQAHDSRATPPRLIEKLVLRPLGAGRYAVGGIDQQGRAYGSSGGTPS